MSCPYTFPQNDRAERMIRTTNDVVRSLLFQASLPTHYWAEALATATYLLNRLPTKAVAHPTPYFALFGIHPSYDHLRVFGCACYPNLASTAPHKLAPRSTRCVFLGYSPDHKGYQCLDLTSHRVLISRHVVFDESDFAFSSSHAASLTELDMFLDPDPVSPTIIPSLPTGRPLPRLARSCLRRPPPHSPVRPRRFLSSLMRPCLRRPPRTAACGLGVPCVASRGPACVAHLRTATCGLGILGAALLRTATCDLVVPSIASCGPTVSRTASCGTGAFCTIPRRFVVSLHRSHPDVSASWSTRYPGSLSRRGPDLSPRRRPPGSSTHPLDGHPARGRCPSAT
jgi:hypothetical protein